VHAVFGFVEYLGAGSAEDFVGNFLFCNAVLFVNLSADGGFKIVEAGQAVEEDAVGVMGHVHHVHGYAVGGEELDALFELSLFAHGNPNVGVDSVRTVNSSDIFGEFDLCAGGLCKLAHFFNKMILGEESLGSDADKVHTEFCGDDHEGVAHVVACITDINELDLVEGLGDVFHDGEAVCKNLSGMIQVGEAVPYGNARMLCEQLNGLLLETAEFNAVIETAENLCGVLKGFLFAHLAVGKEGYMCAFVKRGNLECAAGAGGSFFEKKNDVLACKQITRNTGTLFCLKVGGKVEKITDFIGSEILEGKQGTPFKINRHGKSPLCLFRAGRSSNRRRNPRIF